MTETTDADEYSGVMALDALYHTNPEIPGVIPDDEDLVDKLMHMSGALD